MVRTFKDKPTAALFAGNVVRKLKMIDVATSVMDLRVPRGNQLEALKGNRKGQYSIRIDDQWRGACQGSCRMKVLNQAAFLRVSSSFV